VLHVRADPINAGLALATGSGSGAITAGLIEQLEADAQQREARARAGFEQFCAETGLAVPGAPAEQPAGPSAESLASVTIAILVGYIQQLALLGPDAVADTPDALRALWPPSAVAG